MKSPPVIKTKKSFDAASSPLAEEKKKPGRKSYSPEENLKRRLSELYKTVYNYKVN